MFPVLSQPFGRFASPNDVRMFMELYDDEKAQPYIPWSTWGTNPGDKSQDHFIEEVTRGEVVLSHEGSNPIKFVRDIGATITMRVSCRPSESGVRKFLQEYRRNANGFEVKRRHQHSSLSEKLVTSELQGLGVDLANSWIPWWNAVCMNYELGALNSQLHEHLLSIIQRLLWEELRRKVSFEDIGLDRLKFVPIEEWAKYDTSLSQLEPDGTYRSDSYRGLWTRNRLLCMEWDMPVVSSMGHTLYHHDGYKEPNTNHVTRWIREKKRTPSE